MRMVMESPFSADEPIAERWPARSVKAGGTTGQRRTLILLRECRLWTENPAPVREAVGGEVMGARYAERRYIGWDELAQKLTLAS